MFDKIISFIRSLYGNEDFIPLHEPRFIGNEKKYLEDCIDSTFVSSVGKYVDRFEQMAVDYTKSSYAVATMNGTAALHMGLLLADVKPNDEILTQALTFVATANAISYCNAYPIFIDSAKDNFGMCPDTLQEFLKKNTVLRDDGYCYNVNTGRRIKACVPMHVFGHSAKIREIINICSRYNIEIVEDAAEALGSFFDDKHLGTLARMGVLSFNGNKTITSGSGGMLLFQDEKLAQKAKHLTTTAKIPHKWEYIHDEVGFNYRLPNLNAALACAQMEYLPKALDNKRETAQLYDDFFNKLGINFIKGPRDSNSNYWLNAILLENKKERDDFLEFSNSKGVMTRPIWTLMNKLPAFESCQTTSLENAQFFEDRIVNIPSSVRL